MRDTLKLFLFILSFSLFSIAQTISHPGGGSGGGSGGSPISGLTTGSVVVGASSSTVSTPCTGCTLDSSGNYVTPGTIETGRGSPATSSIDLKAKTSGNVVTLTIGDSSASGTVKLPGVTGTTTYVSAPKTVGNCPQFGSDGIGLVDSGSSNCGGGGGGGGSSISAGSIASLPGSPTAGQMYLPTDSVYTNLLYGGSAWQYFYSGQSVVPPSGTYSWTNQNSATVTKQTNGVWSFSFSNGGSTVDSLNIYDAATPSVPFTAVFRSSMIQDNMAGDGAIGFSLRESATGKIIAVSLHPTGQTCTSGACWVVNAWNSPTSYNGGVGSISVGMASGGLGLTVPTIKISVASGGSGNITISWSPDGGVTFFQLYQAAKNSFFTTGPDNIGFMGNNNTGSNKDIYMTVIGIN